MAGPASFASEANGPCGKETARFAGDARSWLNLQAACDLRVAKQASAKRIEREITPAVA